MADVDFGSQNYPKYANVMNGGVGVLGTGASTVGATALGTDGIAADAKVVYTPGAFGGNVYTLLLSTDDTAAVNVRVYLLDTGTSAVHPLGIVAVPALSGTVSVAVAITVVDGINGSLVCLTGLQLDQVYRKYIPVRASFVVKIAVAAAMTANKILYCKTTGMDYSA
jgi:hypothetical protein